MSHLPNWKEMGPPVVGQDATLKEPVEAFDKNYGSYKHSDAGKPTKAIASLPAEPKPFSVSKK
jgi:hypothetical protein